MLTVISGEPAFSGNVYKTVFITDNGTRSGIHDPAGIPQLTRFPEKYSE